METKSSCFYFLKVCFVALLYVVAVNAACNVCQKNHVACINSTHFYHCFGETTPNTETLYSCKDGFECTDANAICLQKNAQRAPSCGDTSLCGLCSAHRNFLFACTSRTTFKMCYGANQPDGQDGVCPQDFVCDAASDAVCVAPTQSQNITCDILETPVTAVTTAPTATTATTAPPTTPPSMPMPSSPDEICAEKRRFGLYPAVPSDPQCSRYISCYRFNELLRGNELSCSSGSYFDTEREQCTLERPSYCVEQ